MPTKPCADRKPCAPPAKPSRRGIPQQRPPVVPISQALDPDQVAVDRLIAGRMPAAGARDADVIAAIRALDAQGEGPRTIEARLGVGAGRVRRALRTGAAA